ncbi:uncharacterized protein LOC108023787 [Drosophila biarmipes]|uniref:uncharacterized protein LOC108023787 n=1 Tax=Drosophila biarmipes TaxID=125945 RepID=UPI0021CD0344|nr:uncharacterized protein LOC108023787 [Drosophila biarmipes]
MEEGTDTPQNCIVLEDHSTKVPTRISKHVPLTCLGFNRRYFTGDEVSTTAKTTSLQLCPQIITVFKMVPLLSIPLTRKLPQKDVYYHPEDELFQVPTLDKGWRTCK